MAVTACGASTPGPDADAGVERPPIKPIKVNLQLCLKNSYTKEDLGDCEQLSAEEVYEKAQALKTLHLEWLNIGAISNLEPFENTEVLYMQHNLIKCIEGLDFMPKLRFLALQHNHIEVVENLQHLCSLEFLDLSSNRISELEVSELPRGLQILNLRANPCVDSPDYHDRLRSHLVDLGHLDGKAFDNVNADSGNLSLATHVGDSSEVQLSLGEKGLTAYYRRNEMREGITSNIEEQIQAYSAEALADVDGFSGRVDDAVKRSEGRRKSLDERLTAVKQAMSKAEAKLAAATDANG